MSDIQIRKERVEHLPFFTVSQASTTISDGDEIILANFNLAANTTLKVFTGSVANNNGNAPTGMEIKVRNVTDGVDEHSTTSTYETGDPLTEADVGGDHIQVRLVNNTGSDQDMTGLLAIQLL